MSRVRSRRVDTEDRLRTFPVDSSRGSSMNRNRRFVGTFATRFAFELAAYRSKKERESFTLSFPFFFLFLFTLERFYTFNIEVVIEEENHSRENTIERRVTTLGKKKLSTQIFVLDTNITIVCSKEVMEQKVKRVLS